MEVHKVLLILCLCFVYSNSAPKKVASKLENEEDTYGEFSDENVQNDDFYTADLDSPPGDENNPPTAEEQVDIITKPGEFSAYIGDTLKLPCEVSNPNIVIIWEKEAELLFQDGAPMTKVPNIREIKNHTLEVKVESDRDYGNYSCILMTTNDASKRPIIIHRVVSPSPPQILEMLTNKNNQSVYSPGETLILTCNATGSPKPIISWHTENGRLPTTGETLEIPNLTVANEGLYTCFADNKPPNQSPKDDHPAYKTRFINIERAPKITVEEYIVTSSKSKGADLTCTVDAYPRARVIWKKGNDNIIIDGKYKLKPKKEKWNKIEEILSISDLDDEDYTNYTCFAKNSLGKTEEVISLVKVPVVKGFVEPEKNNKDIVLTWKVESISPISAHEIQYRKKGENDWKVAQPEMTVSDSNIYTVKYTLKDLDAGSYETRVRSKSEHGWSDFSDTMPFEGVLAKHGSPIHKNHHKKHHKDPKEKELKEKYISPVQEGSSSLQQQEIIQKEAPVGASQPGSGSSVKSSAAILSIAIILLFSIRQ